MAKKKQVSIGVLVTALIVLGIIQVAAMHYGIDGVFRAMIAGLIGGIVGLTMPQLKLSKE